MRRRLPSKAALRATLEGEEAMAAAAAEGAESGEGFCGRGKAKPRRGGGGVCGAKRVQMQSVGERGKEEGRRRKMAREQFTSRSKS